MVDVSTGETEDPVIRRINSLKTDEIVKDLLQGWYLLRKRFSKEISRYKSTSQLKTEAKRLAQGLYDKYSQMHQKPQLKVVKDEGIFKEAYSVLVYGKEIYPLFGYPVHFIRVETLASDNFYRVFHEWPNSYVSLEQFSKIFFNIYETTRFKFSPAELELVKALYSQKIETRSGIGFPTVPELMKSGTLSFAESTLRGCFHKLFDLGILSRHSVINYARIGLTPLLKIYSEKEEPGEVEKKYSVWESMLPLGQKLWIMAIPTRSSFWFEHSAQDTKLLHSQVMGMNIHSFKGTHWVLNNPSLPKGSIIDVDNSSHTLINYKIPCFTIRKTDLQILNEVQVSGDRKIKEIANRTGYTIGFISKRLNELRNTQVFQTYLKLLNVGLDERYYIFLLGKNENLIEFEQFICQLPRFYITRGKESLFALVWIPSELRSTFLKLFTSFKESIQIERLQYGKVKEAEPHRINLLELWDDKTEMWFSEA